MSGRDRRDLDRRGHDRDDYSRKHPTSSSARPQLNEYWIAGEGINRQVLQTEICKYLGAEATCRPGEYQGVPGFKIKALRPFTPDMLDDLRSASKAFSNENRAYVRRHDRGNASSISPSPVPSPVNNKFGGLWLTPPPELAYSDSQTYEQTNPGADYDRPYPPRDSPAYTPASTSYAVSSAPGYAPSSAGFSAGPSPLVSHPGSHAGLPISSPASAGYGQQDHYGHPSSRDPRDSRDAMMRDAPSYSNYPPGHSQGFHTSGPSYGGDAYGGQRGDPRGDSRMAYDGYGGGGAYSNGPPRRQEPAHYDTMSGLSGPGANGYGSSVPSRNGMPAYADQGGYDPYSRGAPVESRYGGRR